MTNSDKLVDLLYNTRFFSSIQEPRILAFLINSDRPTAKEICTEMGIPDSKVYPSLKVLIELGLIQKDSTHRPNTYYFGSPEVLNEFLKEKTNLFISDLSSLKSSIIEKVEDAWNPSEREFDGSVGQVAYIFKDKSIDTEIVRLQKSANSKLLYLLSSGFEDHLPNIVREIPKLLEKDIQIDLAYPVTDSFTEALADIITLKHPKLRIKVSNLEGTSYIVRDQDTMLNITHRTIGEMALLTNDSLLVPYIDGCWTNDECCITPNFKNYKDVESLIEIENRSINQ